MIKNTDDLKAAVKATWASITPQQSHDELMQQFLVKESKQKTE